MAVIMEPKDEPGEWLELGEQPVSEANKWGCDHTYKWSNLPDRELSRVTTVRNIHTAMKSPVSEYLSMAPRL